MKAFDFEYKTLFYGQYIRSNSYFSNLDGIIGLPANEELKIIEQLNNDFPKKCLKFIILVRQMIR